MREEVSNLLLGVFVTSDSRASYEGLHEKVKNGHKKQKKRITSSLIKG